MRRLRRPVHCFAALQHFTLRDGRRPGADRGDGAGPALRPGGVSRDLDERHVPVSASVPAIRALFVEEHDDKVTALGVKGVGEAGIIGVAAAVANAAFNATGLRVRALPITLDKRLGGLPAQAVPPGTSG
jgi:hypothetical protein